MTEPCDVCPLLLPQDGRCQLYDGFVAVQVSSFRILYSLHFLAWSYLLCEWEFRLVTTSKVFSLWRLDSCLQWTCTMFIYNFTPGIIPHTLPVGLGFPKDAFCAVKKKLKSAAELILPMLLLTHWDYSNLYRLKSEGITVFFLSYHSWKLVLVFGGIRIIFIVCLWWYSVWVQPHEECHHRRFTGVSIPSRKC